MHIWFNRTFSSIYAAISLIKQADKQADKLGEFHLTYSHPNPYSASKNVADHFIEEPANLSAQDYLEWCLQTCRKQKIDIFWPGKEARLIAEHRQQFEAIGTRVFSVATPEVLSLLNDKAQFCQEVNLPLATPAAFKTFTNIEEFDLAFVELKQNHERLCVKPSVSVYGLGFSILDEKRNAAELLIAGEQYKIGYQDFRRGLKDMGSCKPMLLMEYLDGAEYSVDCVGHKGRLITAIPRKKPLLAGYGQLIELNAVVLQAVTHLTEQFQLNGIFNVQFKEAQGKPRLLEINARMSGGIAMACQAGPNLPYIALKTFAHGPGSVEIPEIASGLRVAEIALPINLS